MIILTFIWQIYLLTFIAANRLCYNPVKITILCFITYVLITKREISHTSPDLPYLPLHPSEPPAPIVYYSNLIPLPSDL